MTQVLPIHTNKADQYSSSDVARDGLRHHLQWLSAQHDQKIATVPNETVDRPSSDEAEGRNDAVKAAVSKLKEQRAKAIQNVVRRMEREMTERQDAPAVRVTGMQKWEGRVIELDDDIFSVELLPFESGPEVIADFPRHLVSDEDDLQVGDVVYVTVRVVRGSSGPHHTSTIRVRRLGRWTESEIAEHARAAKKEAAELASYIE